MEDFKIIDKLRSLTYFIVYFTWATNLVFMFMWINFHFPFFPSGCGWRQQSPYICGFFIIIIEYMNLERVYLVIILKIKFNYIVCKVNFNVSVKLIDLKKKFFLNWFMFLTFMSYQKLRHSLGCSAPLNPGVVRIVVAELASVSFAPAIANFLSPFPSWSFLLNINCKCKHVIEN